MCYKVVSFEGYFFKDEIQNLERRYSTGFRMNGSYIEKNIIVQFLIGNNKRSVFFY